MKKDKLRWCLKQKKGISLISSKSHLSESYLKESDECLRVCCEIEGNWKLITGYYACYNAFYSLLMKTGVKCEIHECSIELMDLFGFSDEEIDFLKQLKNNRIQVQYYLKDISLGSEKEVKDFVLRCKEILEGLDSKKIEEIRERIKNF